MKKIRIIATGGTIDAVTYDFDKGEVLSFGEPAVNEILKVGRVRNLKEFADVILLPQKDSLAMNDEDREKILQVVLQKSTPKCVLIIHGTDTMPETGRLLYKYVKEKTVVLTGAMRPNVSENSDAPFDVGGAWIACQTLPYGVYIVANGEIFPAQSVKKNRENPNDPHFENVIKV
jgi:L-asparaginase